MPIIDKEDLEIYKKWLPIIKESAYVGYTISIIFLIISLVIFINIKKLHCERNKLHVHLFLSFILRAGMYMLKDSLFMKGIAMSNDATYYNGQVQYNFTWICKLFVATRYYVILSNFTFMLMEGLYLHNLIFLNLFSEYHGTLIYRLLGWAVPLFFIIPWTVLRMFFEDTLCWTQNDKIYIGLLLDIPIAITVVVNFVLFIIIIRVLVLKIHFTSTFILQKRIKYRKLLKSTLILIPLYGMPYTVSLPLRFYIHRCSILEIMWLFFDQTFTSYQGSFAALVYCLFNGEVQNEIKRKYNSLMDKSNNEFRRSRTISSNTQQFSLQNNDDTLENLKLFGIVDDDAMKNLPKLDTTET